MLLALRRASRRRAAEGSFKRRGCCSAHLGGKRGGKAQAEQQAASSMALVAHRANKGLLGQPRSGQSPLICKFSL